MRHRSIIGRKPHRLMLLACCTALAALQACHRGGSDDALQRYLNALGEALFVALPTPRAMTPPLPAAQDWQVDIEASAIEELDILKLSGCAVQTNINRRQTPLGHSAKPSQKLLMALDYLRLVPQCIKHLREIGDDETSAVLEHAWQEQRTTLPVFIFNATLGSAEFHSFWLTPRTKGGYPPIEADQTASALTALNAQVHRWLNGDYLGDKRADTRTGKRAENREFELLLSAVAGGDGGAALLASQRQLSCLNTANRFLERSRAADRLCSLDRLELARRIAALRQQFTLTVAPRIRQSIQRYYVVSAAIRSLETHLDTELSETYRRWMDSRNREITALQEAATRHVKLLGTIPQACERR
jgi:hypothetical protein